jgi:hypothetical protein
MDTHRPPLRDPRLIGVREQFERAKFFLWEAVASSDDPQYRFRRLMASVYFARSVVEIILEASVKRKVKKNRTELEADLVAKLPRYALIEKIRIHDFHRFGIVPHNGLVLAGPIKLTARSGDAGFMVPLTSDEGRMKIETGKSHVEEQRPLQMWGEQIFDEESNSYLSLDQILDDYLKAVPSVIEDFEAMLSASSIK